MLNWADMEENLDIRYEPVPSGLPLEIQGAIHDIQVDLAVIELE